MTRFSAYIKEQALNTINKSKENTGWAIGKILKHLGLKRSLYYVWAQRRRENRLEDILPRSFLLDRLLPEEEQSIIEYALIHPKEGYRRLAWMMVDNDIAYVSPSSVYNVLDEHDLLYRWKRTTSIGIKPPKPTRPNEQWHIDIMYLWIGGRWYFMTSVLDAYSRYIVHWELLKSMHADEVTLVLQRALEKVPGATPKIVNDHGTQFTSKEFKRLVRQFELEQIYIRIRHPESNGNIERFHRTLREEGLSEEDLAAYDQAVGIITKWVKYYNNERLHAGIRYLRPNDYYTGNPEKLITERTEKLSKARETRRIKNIERFNKTCYSKGEDTTINSQPICPICA